MPEIKEVIRRLYLTREEITERFPELILYGGSSRFMVEEVYRPAIVGEVAQAVLRTPVPDGDWPGHPLILRGTRFASGRWLSQPQQPQQAQDAAEEERAPG